jgi:hypothetical protein
MSVIGKLGKGVKSNEILVLSCYKKEDTAGEEGEGFILVGGNSHSI